ncbi:MAG: hypothetical protein R3F14_02990 [Polyangiaceae bacterium]
MPSLAPVPWKRLGPGGGGALHHPTVHPLDPDTVLVASDMTGSFVTRDGGRRWKMLDLDANAGAFAFDPVSPTTVYSGTNVGTLLRSDDGGGAWTLLFPRPASIVARELVGDHADTELTSTDPVWVGPWSSIRAVLVDPADRDRLFIAATGTWEYSVLQSRDAGLTWAPLTTLEGTTEWEGTVSLAIDPTSTRAHRRLLGFAGDEGAIIDAETGAKTSIFPPVPDGYGLTSVTMGTRKSTGQTVLYAATGYSFNSADCPVYRSGVFRSLDLGATWKPLSTGLDARYVPGTNLAYRRIAASASDGDVVFVASEENNGRFGILKSTDLGEHFTWALELTNPSNRPSGWVEADYAPVWAGGPLGLTVSPSNPQVVYATDWGTAYRTTDGGATWENLYTDAHPDGTFSTRGLDITNANALVFDPFDRAHVALVSSSDVGLFVSSDGARSWRHSWAGVPEGWRNSTYALVFDPMVPGKAWSAWADVHDLPRYRYIRQPYDLDKNAGGVCTSEDGLATWQCGQNGLPPRSVPTSLLLDPASPPGQRTLYTTVLGRGIYRSDDDGQTWSPRNTGILPNGYNAHIYAWEILRAEDSSLYTVITRSARPGTHSGNANYNVATRGALYRSTDGAATWQSIPLPEGVVFPSSLAADPESPSRLYLACWPKTLEPEHIDRYGGLYRSDDGGATWSNVFDPRAHVYGVTVDPAHTNRVYITTFEGAVLRSDDRGATWAPLGGLHFRWPKNLLIDPVNFPGRLFVTTFGGGVFMGSDRGTAEAPNLLLP